MYISATDLTEIMSERSLIELSNDDSRPTAVNQDVVNKACQHACETVDGYLRSRYVLPLSAVPTIVRNICLYLARHWLYSRRPENKGFPDNVKETYKQALEDLKQIASGKFHLGLAEIGSNTDDVLHDVPRFQVRATSKTDLSGY
ncbi:Mu-like prophage protein gp36 [Actinobacillus equuli]|nr:Mu-like prophage protein gp36 [Actinobacillus equuli]